MRLSITTLGVFEIKLDDAVVAPKSAKARALLAYLAVEADRPHRREALAEMLWPERINHDSLGNLRYILADLRKAINQRSDLSQPHLLVDRTTIQFNRASDHWLDVAILKDGISARPCDQVSLQSHPEAVAALTAAVNLYKGPFLEGFSIDGTAFEEWALLRREEIERRTLAGLRCLAGFYERQRRYEEAEAYLRQLLALEPWNEPAHGDLMRVLALDGRRSAALAHFDVARRVLRQELDVAPAPETVDLFIQIRSGALARTAAATHTARPPTTAAVHPGRNPPASAIAQTYLLSVRTQRFVDRLPEIARLDAALQQALSGQGAVIGVCGKPGTGKTALVRYFAQQSMQHLGELIVLLGHCNAYNGAGDPLHPFREILHTLAGDPSGSLLNAEHGGRLRQLAPTDVNLSLLSQPDRFQAVVDLLCSVAQRYPLLLILENLHWADSATLGLLFALSRKLENQRLLLVITFRHAPTHLSYQPNESARAGSSELESLVNEIRRRDGDILIDLDDADGQTFINAMLDSEPNDLNLAFRNWLFDLTAGIPLDAVDVLEDLRQRGQIVCNTDKRWVAPSPPVLEHIPPRVDAALALRIEHQPPSARRLLEAASAQGPVFTAEVVASAAGMTAQEVVNLLGGPLTKAERLVVPTGITQTGDRVLTRYRFNQGLMQRYLYANLDEAQRVYWHRAIAEAIETMIGAHDTQHLALADELLARQFAPEWPHMGN
jgi:DNA-binding SARP family transcriptional activator